MNMKHNNYELSAIRSNLPIRGLRRELGRAISWLAVGAVLLNAIYLFLSCNIFGAGLAEALCVPVCSLLILTALVFLKKAVIELFRAVYCADHVQKNTPAHTGEPLVRNTITA